MWRVLAAARHAPVDDILAAPEGGKAAGVSDVGAADVGGSAADLRTGAGAGGSSGAAADAITLETYQHHHVLREQARDRVKLMIQRSNPAL